jgi:hypothetical protein
MNGQSGWRNQPSIETRLSDDPLAIEKTGLRHASASYACYRHCENLPCNVRTKNIDPAHARAPVRMM